MTGVQTCALPICFPVTIGAVQNSIVDVNYNTARKIQKEVENFYYDMITRRMPAEAAKEQAAAMVDKNFIVTGKRTSRQRKPKKP